MRTFAIIILISAIFVHKAYRMINENDVSKKHVEQKVKIFIPKWVEVYPIKIARKDDGSLVDTIDNDIQLPVKKVKIHSHYETKLYQLHDKFYKNTKTKYINNIDEVAIPDARDDLTNTEENIVRIFRNMPILEDSILEGSVLDGIIFNAGKLESGEYIKFIKKIREKYIKQGKKFSNGRSLYSYAMSKYWNNHYTESPRIANFSPYHDVNEYLYDGTTLIMNQMVSSYGNVQGLLFEGANPNLISRDGGATALHYAAIMASKYSDGLKFNTAIYNNFSFLLSYGADINAQTIDNWYIYEGLKNGKILRNKISNKGITPLMIIENDNSFLSKILAELLLENGADVNLEDEEGNTAINYVALPTDVKGTFRVVQEKIEALVRKGADPMHKNFEGKTIFDRIEEEPARYNFRNKDPQKNMLKDNKENIGIPYEQWVERVKKIYNDYKKSTISEVN